MNRGHILRELVLEQLKALIEDGIIQINDKLKYNADKNFTDPLDIPSLGYIQALIEQGGSETLRRTFIIPAGTSAPSGVISLVGLTNEQGDQIIPDKALWAIYDGGRSGGQQYVRTNSEVQGLETDENELTVNEVLVVLDGVENEITYKIRNESNVSSEYFTTSDPSIKIIDPDQEVEFQFIENEVITINLFSGQFCNFKVIDSSGQVLTNEDTAPGPSSIAGFPLESDKSQIYTLKNDI